MDNKVEYSRELNEKEIDEILSLSTKQITEDLFIDYFANRASHEARFHTNDYFKLPKGTLFNETEELTTIGRYIWNLFVLEYDILKIIGYQNYAMGKKGLGKIASIMSKLLLEDIITAARYIQYLDKVDFMYGLVKYLGPSLTLDFIKPTPKAQAKKEELCSKYEKELSNGDFITMNKIEKEVLDIAETEVDEMSDYEIYKSGATGKWNNSFKNSTYFRGAIRNLADADKYSISTESLLDGIPPEETYLYADIMVQGAHGRAIGTREGGYVYKQLAAALQTIVLDEPGTDCGTKGYKEIKVTEDIADMLKYRYIVEGKDLVQLTPDNIKNYIGKTVKLRSPMYCVGNKYCSKCAGELFYKIDDLRNVGLICNRVGTSLLNASLKAFHDLSLKIVNLNIDDYID